MEIDIEADEVAPPRLQELRRRKRSECAKAGRIDFLRYLNQFINESRSLLCPAPSDDFRGDFIGNAKSENRGMIATGGDCLLNILYRLLLNIIRFQETKMFGPGNVHQHLQPE